MTRRFIAGDIVRHAPTGEEWILIVDEWGGNVVPGGWPDTRADAKDCSLIKPSPDREKELRSTANSSHSAASLADLQLRVGTCKSCGKEPTQHCRASYCLRGNPEMGGL